MKLTKLKYLCISVSRGGAPSYADGGNVYVVGQSCQRPDGTFDFARARRHVGPVPDKGVVRGGEVVVNSTGVGTIGRSALVPDLGPAVAFADSHVTVLRPNRELVDSRFIAYVLGSRSFVSLAEQSLAVGATKQRELNVEALRNHRVPIHPVGRQQRIAEFLDAECLRVRAAIDAATLLSSGATATALARFSELNRHNPVTKLGRRFDVQLGKMLDSRRNDGADQTPYLRNANVQWNRLDLRSVKTMSFSAAEKSKLALRPGDLLVCEGGEPGRSAVWNGDELRECYFQKALMRVRARATDVPRFVMWALWLSSARGDLAIDGTGSAIAHLPAERLREWRLPLPDPVTQHAVVAETESIANAGLRMRSRADQITRALTTYRDSLIHEVVTGKLDVARASDAQMDERLHAAVEGRLDEVRV